MSEEDDKTYLDDVKIVTHHLRHSCDGITKIKTAAEIIVIKSGLSKERVDFILRRIAKNLRE